MYRGYGDIEELWRTASVSRFVSVLVGGGLVAGVLALMLLTGDRRSGGEFEYKKEQAATMLLYMLEPDQRLYFNVSIDDRKFFLVSHCFLPPNQALNPYSVVDYSLRTELIDQSNTVTHEQTFYIRTRQSKIPLEVGGHIENAFLKPGEGELTDARVSSLPVLGYFPRGGRIRVTLLESSFPVLLRIHRLEERTLPEREEMLRQSRNDERQELARKMGLQTLDELSFDEERKLFPTKWGRIEAFTDQNTVVPTKRIYFSGLYDQGGQSEDVTVAIPPGRSKVVNVRGEGELGLALLSPERPVVLEVSSLAHRAGEERDLPAGPLELRPGTLEWVKLPGGVRSVVLHNPEPLEVFVQFSVREDRLEPVGYSNLIPDQVDPGVHYLTPELARLETHLVVPGPGGTLGFSTLGSNFNAMYRLDVREYLQPGEQPQPFVLRLGFLDDQGRKLQAVERTLVSRLSRFETLTALLPENDQSWVSEPHTLYVRSPLGARWIELEAERILAVRCFSETLLHPADEEVYPRDLLGRVWRYPRQRSDHWQLMSPRDLPLITEQNRLATLLAQVRLELPDGETVGEGTGHETEGDWASGTILDQGQEQILLMPLTAEETRGKVLGGVWCRLQREQARRVLLPPDSRSGRRGQLSLIFSLPAEVSLGGEYELVMDGTPLERRRPRLRNETLLLEGLRPREGRLTFRHTFLGGDPLLYVKLEPGEVGTLCRGGIMRAFEVVRIGPGELRRFGFHVLGREPFFLNLAAYAATGTVKLEVTIDGGKPRRKRQSVLEAFTSPVERLELALDQARPRCFLPRYHPFTAPLVAELATYPVKTELTPGWHRLVVRNRGDQEVWLRVFYRPGRTVASDAIRLRRFDR
ncbi:MAG: hypothetical protein A2284_16125 [Deltaproteobacteria bacterium RIFOXYA12_FULL_61_11]|nr:MAG: hypothetical protein A2284_16125 [Deltaproteobacteria bacterium RIFOXYA12_FULL_61_11]